MTHELKKIIVAFEAAQKQGLSAVLATVVALEGSSYRRPGVRMLLLSDGGMVGAVSGGCVEKEVLRQAESVFLTGVPKVMTYDGRYRLGCEGILYILLEPFAPSKDFLSAFRTYITKRKTFTITSTFEKKYGENKGFGSYFHFDEGMGVRNGYTEASNSYEVFEQTMQPCFKLVIIGAEHDAVQLCSYAAMTGWEVTVVAHPKEEKSLDDFKGAVQLLQAVGDSLQLEVDKETAIVLMTHSFVKDLEYMIALKEAKPAYFGLLGPARRREKLFDELLERHPDMPEAFLEQVHGPAGLDIGAETPQEIAVSVLAEILAVVNQKEPILLKEKVGRIHT
ncbi:XdhC family protein [Flagellimonas lutaonensis]|uniref:XshC-Cox1-family protein n=1 Tax=Flagellimonas lutaonensis TaxID=516051 RepID=A0A0D5YWU8_9FLAO|nr:XdhC/CoxI family protein [Allomuricauda lutaonensis]AKA36364.1 XshC-Cox1-family protein [Allomuricauda lutaonensis]